MTGTCAGTEFDHTDLAGKIQLSNLTVTNNAL